MPLDTTTWTHHHVTRQELLSLQHDPGVCAVSTSSADNRENSDPHHESNGEHKAAEDFDDARIARGQPWGATLEDFGEQSAEGEHGAREELSSSQYKHTSRDDVA